MALSQSVLSELLDAFRAGEGVDLVRDAVRLVMQELIEVEAAQQIGAARYERTDTRLTERNGSRLRWLATQAGDIELHRRRRPVRPPHRTIRDTQLSITAMHIGTMCRICDTDQLAQRTDGHLPPSLGH
jgi:transposase-like protein